MEPTPHQEPTDIPPSYETERAKHWFLLDYPALKQVLESLDSLSIRGSQIISFAYVNTASLYSPDKYVGPMDFEDLTELPHVLEHIGDIGMNEEFPNNFKVALAVATTDGSRLLVEYECDEQPEICEACDPTHTDDYRSCEHGTDSATGRYSVDFGQISDDSVEQAMMFL